MTSTDSRAPPEPFKWTSLEGRTIIREILEVEVPQWTAPRDTQIDCWAHVLQGVPTILIASTGWGKTSAFFIPILVLKYLKKYPNPRIFIRQRSPIAFVVTPLIELGNAHALGRRSRFEHLLEDESYMRLRASIEHGRNNSENSGLSSLLSREHPTHRQVCRMDSIASSAEMNLELKRFLLKVSQMKLEEGNFGKGFLVA